MTSRIHDNTKKRIRSDADRSLMQTLTHTPSRIPEASDSDSGPVCPGLS